MDNDVFSSHLADEDVYVIEHWTNGSVLFDNFLTSCRASFGVRHVPLGPYIELKEKILKEYGARHIPEKLVFSSKDEYARFILTYG